MYCNLQFNSNSKSGKIAHILAIMSKQLNTYSKIAAQINSETFLMNNDLGGNSNDS